MEGNPPQEHRFLGGSGDDGGYLVDADGNSYPPYSLSWRYLGLFLDSCDDNNNRNRRRLENDDNNYSCRKVLWAAYHDPDYTGHSIAEYQFYNARDGSWDGSTCRARTHGLWWPFARCQKLDCHELGTKLELVGVFKETDGLYDFTEQLFKHQGYCLWNADKNDNHDNASGDSNSNSADGSSSSSDYDFMTNLAENWVNGCTELGIEDDNGNALYYDTKPLAGGDMTYGVYIDDSCLYESSDMVWSDVLEASGNDNNDGLTSTASMDRWNTLLGDYKVCQPCRAYNRVQTNEGGSHDDSGSGSEDSGDYEDGDDGEGGKERWGFNCYDDAGYLNCNQCYKFQTQTDMEPVSTADLERATQQGTILAVKVDGATYGKGQFAAPGRALRVFKQTSAVFVSTAVLIGLGFYYFRKKFSRGGNGGLKERLTTKEEPDGIFWDQDATGSAVPLYNRFASFFFRGQSASTDNTGAPATTTEKTASDYDKRFLVAQLQKRDAELAQQAQLIQQLQEKVAYYESKKVVDRPQMDSSVGSNSTDIEHSGTSQSSGMPQTNTSYCESQSSTTGRPQSDTSYESDTNGDTFNDRRQEAAINRIQKRLEKLNSDLFNREAHPRYPESVEAGGG